MSLSPGVPLSGLFSVKETPFAGRAVFANQRIPSGTSLLQDTWPAISVILREYRREVCAYCYAYDRGRNLDYRDASVNFAFCSISCQDSWLTQVGENGRLAWQAVEAFVQVSMKRRSAVRSDEQMADAVVSRPSPARCTQVWIEGSENAKLIAKLRSQQPDSKFTKRMCNAALGTPAHPDILTLFLSGLLFHVTRPQEWPSFDTLASDAQPFASEAVLQKNVETLNHLAALLPLSVLPANFSEVLAKVVANEPHNAFGIRSLEDNGSEFFGYGVWPSASYWNHSCRPNMSKKRVGRTWGFWTSKDVAVDEELSISYLGGEEDELDVVTRRRRLSETWGFVCRCARCDEEDGHVIG